MPAFVRAPRLAALVAVAFATAACGGKSEPALVATTLTLSTAAITLDALGATQAITATVLDQKGGTMTNATVSWTSNVPAIVTVSGNASATATAVANGTATLTATVGSLTKTVAVTVAQVAVAPTKAAGDQQSATVATTLPTQLKVVIADRLGNGMPGKTVTFAPGTGSGSTAPATVNTAADGSASTTWTLGQTAGTQVVNVSATSVTGTATFTAGANAGAATTLAISAGNNQFTAISSPMPVPPAVKVSDSFGNGKPGVTVTFTPAAGSGTVTGGTAVTNASGIATVGAWTLGSNIGAVSLVAASAGLPNVTFTGTATGGPPANVVVSVGNNQTAGVGANVPIAPAVRVTDIGGNASANATVTFAVATGGGSVTGATATTNVNGIATVGSWTVGAAAGTNTLTATVSGTGITGNPTTFTANATTGSGTYNIELRFLTTATANQTAAFNNAAARWQAIITSDLADTPLVRAAGACGSNSPAINETIDDLIIFVTLEPIDGVGNVLGSAGPCQIRSAGFLSLTGRMRFDTADLTQLENSGRLESVILHEMGHILGIGTLWDIFSFLASPSLPNSSGADTRFTGSNAIAGFNSIGGATYTGGAKVPVENTQGGSGTQDSHWRENVLQNELMTGFLNNGANPLSLLTIRSLQDLGYIVNTGQADTFFLTLTGAAVRATTDPIFRLHNDVTNDPIELIDASGRVTRVIRPR